MRGSLHFVVRVYPRGCFMWPMFLGDHGEYLLGMEAQRLEISYVAEFDDIKVHELGQRPTKISLRSKGEPVTLEAYHVSRGWASLGEDVLRRVQDEFEVPKPGVNEEPMQHDAELCLQVNFTRSFGKDATADDVLRRMHVATTFRTGLFEDFDMGWMRACALEKDAQEKKEDREKEKEKEAKQQKATQARRHTVHQCFASQYKGPPLTSKMAKNKWYARMQRVYDRMDTEAEELVREFVPLATHSFTDHENGRWRATYRPTKQQKSASWTRSGSKPALVVILSKLWEFATAHDPALVAPREVLEMAGHVGV